MHEIVTLPAMIPNSPRATNRYLVSVFRSRYVFCTRYPHIMAVPLPPLPSARSARHGDGEHAQSSLSCGIDKVYIMREPDATGARVVKHIERRLQAWKWPGKASVISPVDAKDPNELHKHHWKGFKAAFQQALDVAEPLWREPTQPAPSSSDDTPSPITLQELLTRQLPPIQWAIPAVLPEGLTLPADKPKLGKSWNEKLIPS